MFFFSFRYSSFFGVHAITCHVGGASNDNKKETRKKPVGGAYFLPSKSN